MASRKRARPPERQTLQQGEVYLYLPTRADPYRVLHLDEAWALLERRKLSQRALKQAMDLYDEVSDTRASYRG